MRAAVRLLTVREAAERLAVCTATIYALVERGVVRHLQVSNAIRIHPDDLEGWLGAGGVLASSGVAPYDTSKALSS